MKFFFYGVALCLMLIQTVSCGQQKYTADSPEAHEALAIITDYHLAKQPPSLAYQAVAIQMMLEEANYFTEKLKLPTAYPIQINDVKYPLVFSPWHSTLKQANYPYWPATVFSNRIFDANIPREQRARALKISVSGVIETTNFVFSFGEGKLLMVERLSAHDVEYYANNLDELVGKPSLIDSNGAYQLATQWLTAVNINVPALEKQSGHSINQLSYQPKGTTNVIVLPLFYVGFGTNNAPKWRPVNYDPAVEVEVLGTTKQLQEILVHDDSFCGRKPIIITNAIDLIQARNLETKHLDRPPTSQTNLMPKQAFKMGDRERLYK